MRLNCPDCLYVICRHLLHCPVRFRLPVRAPCPQPIERIIPTNMSSQLGINEELRLAATSPWKKEYPCLASTRLELDKIRGFFFWRFVLRFGWGPLLDLYRTGQLGNRWSLKKNTDGQIQSKGSVQTGNKTRSRQRMTPEIEEVIVDPDGTSVQNLFPKFHQLLLDGTSGRGIGDIELRSGTIWNR